MANIANNNHVQTTLDEASDFEKAIEATGFGRFNILLILAAIPVMAAAVFEPLSVSYILPSAECDLSLSLFDKGILNAITYVGSIPSAIFWGYIADTRGRKNILVYAHLADVLCVLGAAFSRNVWQLMCFKFIGGLIISGPYPVLMSYLSEFHGVHYRSLVMMLAGITYSIGTLLLPLMATFILPMSWSFEILSMKFNTWQIFLALCAIPSLLSGLLYTLFPETPKFLMSQGRNEEALKALKTIYAVNTGKSKDTYPVKTLINELTEKDNKSDILEEIPRENQEQFVENIAGLQKNKNNIKGSFKKLFSKPYLKLSLTFYSAYVCIYIGQNTIRMWLPTVFAAMNDYQQISTGPATICDVLEYSANRTDIVKNSEHECTVNMTTSTYSNNIVVTLSDLVLGLIASCLIKYVGNRRMQITILLLAGSIGILWYWSFSALTTIIIATLYASLTSIANTTALGGSVNLFPTSLRTMVVSIAIMFGRIGSVTGNILFPLLVTLGCISPFVMFGGVMFLGCALTLFLPDPDKVIFK